MTDAAQLQGGDQLVASLAAAGAQLLELTDAAEHAGQLLARDGSAAAPVLTGATQNAHSYQVVGSTVSVIVATAYAPYAHARDPWLAATLEADQTALIDLYLTGVQNALDNVKGT